MLLHSTRHMCGLSLLHHVKWVLILEDQADVVYLLSEVVGKLTTPLEKHEVCVIIDGEAVEVDNEVCTGSLPHNYEILFHICV